MKDALTVELVQKKLNGGILVERKEFTISMDKKLNFVADVQVFAENDSEIYDPKGKARHARPFKPAILIE